MWMQAKWASRCDDCDDSIDIDDVIWWEPPDEEETRGTVFCQICGREREAS